MNAETAPALNRIDLNLELKFGAGGETYRAACSRSKAVRLVNHPSASLMTDQPELAMAHVAAGGYALCLDPFRLRPADRQTLATSGRAMPVHVGRLVQSVQQIRRSIEQHQLGEPGLLRIHHWTPSGRGVAGGLLHSLDLTLWLFNALPSIVYGVGRPDFVQAHLGFPGGGMALIDMDTVPGRSNAYFTLSLVGSHGAAYDDLHRNVHLLMNSDGMQAKHNTVFSPAMNAVFEQFSRAVSDQQDLEDSWTAVEQAVALEEDIRTAIASGEAVTRGDSHA